MKTLLTALLASAALLTVAPGAASAHEGDGNRVAYRDYDGAYSNFGGEFRHLYGLVQHGLRDGSFSRGEARQFYWAISALRSRLDAYWRNDGYLDRRERWDIQHRIQRLHDDMHDAHANGHAEEDYGYGRDQGGYRNSYGDDDRNSYDRGGYDRGNDGGYPRR